MVMPAVPKIPLQPNPPPMLKVKGIHREIGRQIGETFPLQIKRSLENAHKLLENAYEQLDLT